jgi:hypothetical protein
MGAGRRLCSRMGGVLAAQLRSAAPLLRIVRDGRVSHRHGGGSGQRRRRIGRRRGRVRRGRGRIWRGSGASKGRVGHAQSGRAGGSALRCKGSGSQTGRLHCEAPEGRYLRSVVERRVLPRWRGRVRRGRSKRRWGRRRPRPKGVVWRHDSENERLAEARTTNPAAKSSGPSAMRDATRGGLHLAAAHRGCSAQGSWSTARGGAGRAAC